jgi:hypothetical protein
LQLFGRQVAVLRLDLSEVVKDQRSLLRVAITRLHYSRKKPNTAW